MSRRGVRWRMVTRRVCGKEHPQVWFVLDRVSSLLFVLTKQSPGLVRGIFEGAQASFPDKLNAFARRSLPCPPEDEPLAPAPTAAVSPNPSCWLTARVQKGDSIF
jgi:hypothetical protein